MRQVPGGARCSPLLVRGGFVLILVALLLGGAVPYVAGPGRSYLSYLVVAARGDAGGAALAAREVQAAGGAVVQPYPQIGTVLAYSADGPPFAARLRGRPGIAAAGATRTVPLPAPPGELHGAGDFHPDGRSADGYAHGPLSEAGEDPKPAPGDDTPTLPDPHEAPSWNLDMVGLAGDGAARGETPGLLAGTAGDRARLALHRVLVAVLDSGVDDTHPDLQDAVDPGASASCVDGRPDHRSGAWRPEDTVDESGHGTHVAGIIGAARDGRGVVGIAPGVRIAAVRLLGPLGQYYAENIVCGLLWSADHGARAINDSYFSDPWKYNCPEDPDQAAAIAAIGRAVRYARARGAVVVASAGNDAQDLAAPRTDERSPNDRAGGSSPPVRRLGPECIRLPAELPGVVTVSAVDRQGAIAPYSNYGRGMVSLAAPGGDPDGGADRAVISDWPGGRFAALAGTSMAAAHVSGVLALLAAAHPDAGPDRLRAALEAAARNNCPLGRGACADERYFGAGVLSAPH